MNVRLALAAMLGLSACDSGPESNYAAADAERRADDKRRADEANRKEPKASHSPGEGKFQNELEKSQRQEAHKQR